MIEHERAYMFTWEDIMELAKSKNFALEEEPLPSIEDHYLQRGVRVRHRRNSSQEQWILVRKVGDKSKGHRFEDEVEIDPKAGEILASQEQFRVVKNRYRVTGLTTERPYKITVDFIEKPMRVACLEIEAGDPISMPIPADIIQRLYGMELRECPLCTWDYFNRKIGICGAPSCGKTETAKWLSHTLNTKFSGNAFHVAEYATTFIQKYNRPPEFGDQLILLYGQRAREAAAAKANIVLSDSPTFLNLMYSQMSYPGPFSEKSALHLAKIYKEVLFDINTYTDIIFLTLQSYVENNIRYQSGETEARNIEQRISMFLNDHKIPHSTSTYRDAEAILNNLLHLNKI